MKKHRLPKFATCMMMMRKHDPQTQEEGFHALLPNAAHFVVDLLREFQIDSHDRGLRCWLLELIGEAADPRALPIFLEQLRSDDEALRAWAIHGLRKLDTPAAREALYRAGAPKGSVDGHTSGARSRV